MARCPQCNHNVPFRALLGTAGSGGFICPTCNTELDLRLWARVVTTVVALAVAISVSLVINERLRSSGFGWPLVPITGMVILPLIGVLVAWGGWVSVVRLRRRSAPGRGLGPL